jgi:DUF1365 family protein
MTGWLYVGRVSHVRHAPVPHRFTYRHVLLGFDPAALDRLFAGLPLASVERPNLVSFRRRDYLGPLELPLDEAVRQRVERRTGRRPEGPVLLVTQPRLLGYVFNPVSFYFVHDRAGERVETVVAEITNTPWNERHAYVLPASESVGDERRLRFRFSKDFHVSPFLPMELEYDWSFSAPRERLGVHMRVSREGSPLFDADLALERRPLTGRALARAALGQPGLSLRVISAIYWQALRLKLKRVPFHDHPRLRAQGAGHPSR